MPEQVSVGFLQDDVPYLKVGQGPPLVAVAGLSPDNDVPKGWQHRLALAQARPLAHDFTVYAVGRKRGLRPGESMSDIAGHLVAAIEHDIGEPVFLQGTSTGGSVVLQLAVDRPDLVRRLVVRRRRTGWATTDAKCRRNWRGGSGPGIPETRGRR